MKIKKIIATVCAISVLILSLPVCAERTYSDEYYILDLIANYVAEKYIDEKITKEEAIKIAISGLLENDEDTMIVALKKMLSGLDPYSEYLSAEEYKEFSNQLNNAFYGVGVIIMKIGDYVEVTGFTQGSPSEAAGLMIGDKISKIDGISVKGESLNEVRSKITGELDTYVEVTVLRDDQERTFKIKRSQVKGDTVYYEELKDKIGYIIVTDISENTPSEFSEKLQIMRDTGVKKFILDLRNNGGGYVISAINMAKMIVPKGKIISAQFRGIEKPEEYFSTLTNKEFSIAVLVNGNTASAAEILASAISESGAGKLYGEQTFGKGVMQQSFSLLNGSVIKLTTGKYYTRNGNDIDGVGIKPDEYVENYTVPIDTKQYEQFDYKTKWDIGMDGLGVRAVKQRLYLLSYYSGDTDNTSYGEDIKAAVTKFQAENGLYPYGVLDISTQVKIENSFAKLEVLHDRQFDTAYLALGGSVE